MGKKITLLGIFLFIALSSSVKGNALQSINEIKEQCDNYLYAESTAQTWEEALDNAKYLLGVEIEMWAKKLETKPADNYIAEAQNHVLDIKSMRGDRFRAFVYVKIADIMPVADTEQLVVVPINKEKVATIQDVVLPKHVEERSAYQPTVFEQEMMRITDANDIGAFIKQLKEKGKLSAYGKYRDMPSDIDCYLYVYNRDLLIPAYLHKQGKVFINMKTGKQDQVTNYNGCGAWWFQLK